MPDLIAKQEADSIEPKNKRPFQAGRKSMAKQKPSEIVFSMVGSIKCTSRAETRIICGQP